MKAKTTKTKAKATKANPVPVETVKISIKLGNVIIKGEGATALEALRSIPVPNKITTKGILTISQGTKKKELLYPIPKLKRLFYPQAQPFIIKWLAMLLK